MTTFFTPKQSASLCSNSFGKKQGGMSKILGMKMLDFVRQLSASWCQKTEQVLLCDGLDGLHGRTVQWNEINFEVAFSFPLSWIDFFYYINTGNGKKLPFTNQKHFSNLIFWQCVSLSFDKMLEVNIVKMSSDGKKFPTADDKRILTNT